MEDGVEEAAEHGIFFIPDYYMPMVEVIVREKVSEAMNALAKQYLEKNND